MGQVFDMAYSRWKAAYQERQAELAQSRQSTSETEIHQITHDKFAQQGRAAVIAHLEKRKREAEEMEQL